MNHILEALEMMNSENLFPEVQYLLDVDPEDLATASKDRKQVWQTYLKMAVSATEHVNRQLNLPPECRHKDVQAAHFKPEPTRQCVYKAGRQWHKAKPKKQLMRWKRYNFLENREINSDSSEDKSQPSHKSDTIKRGREGRRQRQSNLNAWLKAKGS